VLDPNMAYEIGKIRQQELIELGQNSARERNLGLRPRRPKFLIALVLLIVRTISR
jgi:hypothetical protein